VVVLEKALLVPPLRFKGFTGNWNEVSLKQLLTPIERKTKKPAESYTSIGIRSHFKGTMQRYDTDPKSNSMEYLYLVHKDDFILNITFAWEGALAIAREEDDLGYVSHRFPTYRVNEDIVTKEFFQYLYPTERMKYNLRNISPGGAGRNRVLNKRDFLKLKVKIPETDEQNKISEFMRSLEDWIQNLKSQKEELEKYKKGMMQKIFSQEIRFKDGNGKDYPDWKDVKFKDIFVVGSGKDYKHLQSGDIPVYGTGGYMTSVNDYLYEGESVGIGRKGTIDKPIFLKNKFWTVDTLFYTHSFKGVLPYFVFLLFQNVNWKKYNEASGVPSLSKNTLYTIKTRVPSIDEQNKIIALFTSLEDLTSSKQNQIEKAEMWKKGLLQEMFV